MPLVVGEWNVQPGIGASIVRHAANLWRAGARVNLATPAMNLPANQGEKRASKKVRRFSLTLRNRS